MVVASSTHLAWCWPQPGNWQLRYMMRLASSRTVPVYVLVLCEWCYVQRFITEVENKVQLQVVVIPLHSSECQKSEWCG